MKKGLLIIGLISLLVKGCTVVEPPYIETTADLSIFEGRFYYEQLSEADQVVYRELYEGVMNGEEEICVHSTDPEDANAILEPVMFDFPEIFWIDGAANATTYGEEGAEGSYTVVEPTYVYAGEKREQMQQEIDASVKEILASIPADYDEYGKIKYVYEYLINMIDYVENAPNNQNIYSAFVNKETVCAGYAKANQYLLNELGIGCIYVCGTAQDEQTTDNHAWNIVECNDKYYYVDITWADPLIPEGEVVQEQEMLYDYLCCSETEIGKSHTLKEGYDYPACETDDLNYYEANGMFYRNVDKQQLIDAAHKTIDAKEGYTIYKFASKELYDQALGLLKDEVLPRSAEYLCDRHNLQQTEYRYLEEPMMNKLVAYWYYE